MRENKHIECLIKVRHLKGTWGTCDRCGYDFWCTNSWKKSYHYIISEGTLSVEYWHLKGYGSVSCEDYLNLTIKEVIDGYSRS